jgi:hypothetical protein
MQIQTKLLSLYRAVDISQLDYSTSYDVGRLTMKIAFGLLSTVSALVYSIICLVISIFCLFERAHGISRPPSQRASQPQSTQPQPSTTHTALLSNTLQDTRYLLYAISRNPARTTETDRQRRTASGRQAGSCHRMSYKHIFSMCMYVVVIYIILCSNLCVHATENRTPARPRRSQSNGARPSCSFFG